MNRKAITAITIGAVVVVCGAVGVGIAQSKFFDNKEVTVEDESVKEAENVTESAVATPTPTPSASPTATPIQYPINVTKSKKAEVKPLLDRTMTYLALAMEEKLAWNDNIKTMMAAYELNYVKGINFDDFTKAKTAVETELAETWKEPVKFDLKSTKDFFGNLYGKNEGSLMYQGGDWGDGQPKGSVKKIDQLSKNTYQVTYEVAVYDASNPKSKPDSKNRLNYLITIEKSSKRYGYVLVKIER